MRARPPTTASVDVHVVHAPGHGHSVPDWEPRVVALDDCRRVWNVFAETLVQPNPDGKSLEVPATTEGAFARVLVDISLEGEFIHTKSSK